MFKLGKTSNKRLEGVHPDLLAVIERALSYGIIDATVVPYGGLRTEEEQRSLVNRGASQTMNSLHRKQEDGYGHAADLAPYPIDWNDLKRFMLFATCMFRAAEELNINIQWGGHWPNFKDYPHWQLGKGYRNA